MVTSPIHHLNGAIDRRTVERWCKIIRKIGLIDLSKPPVRPRIIRSKGMIEKIKNRLKCNKRVSSRKLAKYF